MGSPPSTAVTCQIPCQMSLATMDSSSSKLVACQVLVTSPCSPLPVHRGLHLLPAPRDDTGEVDRSHARWRPSAIRTRPAHHSRHWRGIRGQFPRTQASGGFKPATERCHPPGEIPSGRPAAVTFIVGSIRLHRCSWHFLPPSHRPMTWSEHPVLVCGVLRNRLYDVPVLDEHSVRLWNSHRRWAASARWPMFHPCPAVRLRSVPTSRKEASGYQYLDRAQPAALAAIRTELP
jgi:hypothetical protein